jgi:hypothetical protein
MGLITTDKAAEILGVRPRRVQRLVSEYDDMRELLKAKKLGRDWLLDERAVREYAKKPRKRGRPMVKG